MKIIRLSIPVLIIIAVIFTFVVISLVKVWQQDFLYPLPELKIIVDKLRMCDYPDKTVYYTKEPRKCNGRPLLLVLIVSSPNHFAERHLIRSHIKHEMQTSNYTAGPLWKRIFLTAHTGNYNLQRRLMKEQSQYEDILEGSFRDSKDTILQKIIFGFLWANCHCRPHFLVKSNDDTFIHIKLISYWLLSNYTHDVQEKGFFSGIERRGILKAMDARDIDKVQSFHLSKFLYKPYLLGVGYVMSSDVIDKVLEMIQIAPMFQMEDIYISSLARMAGIDAKNNKNFEVRYNYLTMPACSIRKVFLSGTTSIVEAAALYSLAEMSKTCPPRIIFL